MRRGFDEPAVSMKDKHKKQRFVCDDCDQDDASFASEAELNLHQQESGHAGFSMEGTE